MVLEEFSRIRLAATHIIPVGIALILQINLLKWLSQQRKEFHCFQIMKYFID